MEGIIMARVELIRTCGKRKPGFFFNTSLLFIYYLYISFMKTNKNVSLKMRVVIKKVCAR